MQVITIEIDNLNDETQKLLWQLTRGRDQHFWKAGEIYSVHVSDPHGNRVRQDIILNLDVLRRGRKELKPQDDRFEVIIAKKRGQGGQGMVRDSIGTLAEKDGKLVFKKKEKRVVKTAFPDHRKAMVYEKGITQHSSLKIKPTDDITGSMVIERLSGKTLQDVLDLNAHGERYLSLERCYELSIGLLEDLADITERRIVHKDIKPRNVMVNDDEIPPKIKIFDFGIAAMQGDNYRLNRSVGTKGYVAPEVEQGRNVWSAADIYSTAKTIQDIWGTRLTRFDNFTDTTYYISVYNLLFDMLQIPPSFRVNAKAALERFREMYKKFQETKNDSPHLKSEFLLEAAITGNLALLQQLIKEGADVNRQHVSGRTPLIFAAKFGHSECVHALLAAGAKITIADKNGFKPLLFAAEQGDVNCVKLLIAAGADVNENDTLTALCLAAQNNHLECVNALIAANADVNLYDSHGKLPLVVAANNGHLGCVKALIAASAEVNKESQFGTAVWLATNNGHADCLAALLEAGADPNSENKESVSALHQAIAKGDIHCVKLLIAAANIDLNKRNNEGLTPLALAAKEGRLECLEALIAAGADVNLGDYSEYGYHGFTPLHIAIQNGHTECVNALLKANGIDVNKASKFGIVPLLVAVESKQLESLQALIAAHADVNGSADPEIDSPLWKAAEIGFTKGLEALLNAGADINTKRRGFSLLLEAIHKRHTDCVRILLSWGADPNQVDDVEHYTPLMMAADWRVYESVKLLLAAGGDINAVMGIPLTDAASNGIDQVVKALLVNMDCVNNEKDKKQANEALWCATKENHIECMQLLINAGADVNQVDYYRNSLLHIAVDKNSDKAVEVLLTGHPDLEKKNEADGTPLCSAAEKGNFNCVKILLEAGADKNSVNYDGISALHWAIINRHNQCAKLLIDKKADINLADEAGCTPLWKAAEVANLEGLKLLLEAGADKEKMAKKVVTPLWQAVKTGNLDCVKALVESGANTSTFIKVQKWDLNSIAKPISSDQWNQMRDFVAHNIDSSDNIIITLEDIAKIMGHDDIANYLASISLSGPKLSV